MIVREHWQRRCGRLDPVAAILALDHRPAALLYGEGTWTVLAREPLAVFADVPPPDLGLERRGDVPPIQPDLVGWFTYEHGLSLDPAFPAPHPDTLPGSRWVLYRHVVLHHRPTDTLYVAEREGTPLPWRVDHGTGPLRAERRPDPDPPADYRTRVARIRELIGAGEVYQVNLTRRERWRVRGDRRRFAARLARTDPGAYSAVIADPAAWVVSCSPERFLSWRGRDVVTSPIKGTAPRDDDPARDRAAAAALRADPKNRAELAMIVDLLRNDLGRVCTAGSVTVEVFPRLHTVAAVHHLVADIRGRLLPDVGLADLLRAAFPGGSVTGCPRIAALHVIAALERAPRGIYTGALGWLRADGAQGELSVAIRTAVIRDHVLTLGVGGGIVWDSDPAAEYAETEAKGRSLLACLR